MLEKLQLFIMFLISFISVAYPPPPVQQNATTTTVITQPMLVPLVTHIHYGSTPQSMTCPYCHEQIVTRISFEPGILTWLFCGGLAAVG